MYDLPLCLFMTCRYKDGNLYLETFLMSEDDTKEYVMKGYHASKRKIEENNG